MNIELTVIGLRDLHADELPINPFVKFVVGKNSYETTLRRNTFYPDYNQKFYFTVLPHTTLSFKIMTYNFFGKNTEIGNMQWTISQLILNNTRHETTSVFPRGKFIFSVKCLKGGLPNYMTPYIDPSITCFLKITVNSIYGTSRAFFNKFGLNSEKTKAVYNSSKELTSVKFEAKTLTYSTRVNVKKIIDNNYPTQSSDILSYSECCSIYIEGSVCAFIDFSALFFENINTEKSMSLSTVQYQIPDFRTNEIQDLHISGTNGLSFFLTIECLRSVYLHVDPRLLPPPNDSPSNRGFPCEVDILQIGNMNELCKKHNFLFPSIQLEYQNVQYKTSWMFEKRNGKVPEGWFQGFLIPILTGTTFWLELTFRNYPEFRERTAFREKCVWPDFEGKNKVKFDVNLQTVMKGAILKMEFKRIREVSATFLKAMVNGIPKITEQHEIGINEKELKSDENQVVVESKIEGFSPFSH
ncbi:hypothetical protein EIN_354870 [Entamoeba invadens IP1]|uniref:C2 domain-containing protein n=1 Tax=Entamoeba invadens IP1 TaxID=370355 RepID=L7FKY3_ENTIV|nr:hypothetical protein EIN_354870 [Entamoeba invadens IP1]ELP87165.1 hypothetical protein EIN_354870 [Entamoeba invadens IP1]|eukprot:XP_004253936.1 hypothetical protein EIN_354870 [Entamoeba invadens IP1]